MKKKREIFILCSIIVFFFACKGSEGKHKDVIENVEIVAKWSFEPQQIHFSDKDETKNLLISANTNWSVVSNKSWCSMSKEKGYYGETILKISVERNESLKERSAQLTFSAGKETAHFIITQGGRIEENYVPNGYTLVFNDEFNGENASSDKPTLPNAKKWQFETGDHGWGNNELQNYISGYQGNDTCAIVSDGTLKIIAKKVNSKVFSIRMNSHQSWLYGYFEARLRMPSGKGVWPAFWMLPKDFSNWPLDGEIDIMEYVGYDPNVVHCTVHTQKYNHAIDTQVVKSINVAQAETSFHIYAVEWTADYIKGFVDGKEYFRFDNDKQNNKETWPFNVPFYLKINLAWGGNWGGAQGVDESKLPATYEIDYVRVYQKKSN